MPLLEWIGLGLLVAVVAAIVWLTARRILLVRSGAIDICWRDRTTAAPAHGSGWSFGQAKYSGDELLLYRSFSPLPVASNSTPTGTQHPAARLSFSSPLSA